MRMQMGKRTGEGLGGQAGGGRNRSGSRSRSEPASALGISIGVIRDATGGERGKGSRPGLGAIHVEE